MSYAGEELNRKIDAQTNRPAPLVDLSVRNAEDVARLRARWGEMDGIPKLVSARTEGEDNSFLGLDVRTLLRGEESGGRHSVHSIVVSPGAEIPAHGLTSGDTKWFLLRGELELTIGALTRTVRAPAFGYAPEQTTQAIVNRSADPADVYVVHSPAGVERAFATAHRLWRENPGAAAETFWSSFAPYGFVFTGGQALPNDARTNAPAPHIDSEIRRFEDYADLRERWSRLPPTPKLVEFPREQPAITYGGNGETRLILTPEESRAHASAFCNILNIGWSVGTHYQPTEDELFMLFDGSLRLQIGDQVAEKTEFGAFGFAPRSGTHAFASVGDVPARFMNMNSPGGHDRGFIYGVNHHSEPDLFEVLEAHGFVFHTHSGLEAPESSTADNA